MYTLRNLAAWTVLLLPIGSLPAATFHVSPKGNDAQAGTEAAPFATLVRARDAVRALRRGGPPTEPAVVVVHGGTYRMRESFTLGPEDSGSPHSGVTWRAAAGETVRLVGGPELPGGNFRLVDDAASLARLNPAARGKVVRFDLREAGVDDLAAYPDGFRGAPAIPEVFFNDARLTVARWPNEGWAHVAKIVDAGSAPREGDAAGRPGTFEYSGDRPGGWNAADGVWLLGYWCFDWYEEAIRVKSIDRAKRTITLAKPAVYGLVQGNPSPRRYYALNVLAELDRPGEYFFDRASRQMYLWPPSPLATARVSLSTLATPLIVLKDASYVTLCGMTVEAGLGDGIEVTGGRGNCIAACTVRNMRQLGIRVAGSAAHRVEDCEIHDTGTGGLLLEGGDRRSLTPAGHQAIGNRIHGFSRHQLSYACGLTLSGVGNRAANNLIYDAPHIAVAIAGNDHVFEYNIVRNVCTASDDASALYKGRNPSCRGNQIRYNLWRDIGSPMGHGTAAVYFDDGDGGDVVFGNVFYRCGDPGRGSFGTVFSHGGHDNRAENNIFIECKRALGSAPWDDARWRDALAGGQGCFWVKLLREDVDITKPPFTTRYPELVGFLNPPPGSPRVNRAKNNVLVRCGEIKSGNWTFRPEETWSTQADPGFVDAAKGNFQLRADSEVFRRLPGFQPIAFDKIGPPSRAQRESASRLPAVQVGGAKRSDVTVGFATSMEKILPRGATPSIALSDRWDVSLARGEKESFQVIVVPRERAVRGVRLRMPDLVGPRGAKFPAAAIETAVVGYVETKKKPPYDASYVGWWPDPILNHQQSADIAKGDAQAFWVRVRAAKDQPTGVYRGTAIVEMEGAAGFAFELSVRVFNFRLPEKTPLPLAVTFWPMYYEPNGSGGWREGELRDAAWKTHKHEWADFLADYYLSFDSLYAIGSWAPDFDVLKRQHDLGRLGRFNLGYYSVCGAKPEETAAWRKATVDVIRPRYEKAKALGLLDHAYIYGCDENPADLFPGVQRAAEILKREFPGAFVLTTTYDHSFGAASVIRAVDGFCPLTPKFDPALAAKARAAGKQVWWYICCGPHHPYANMFVEYPAVEGRLLMGAMTAKYRPDGFLYYQISIWNSPPIQSGPFTAWDPRSWTTYHGDGSWTCLGPGGTPLPTIRLENFRDGLEDYAYARILEATIRKVESAGKTAEYSAWLAKARAALVVPDALVKNLADYNRDPAAVYRYRNRLAEAIESAGVEPAELTSSPHP